jgi:hypothetical protein
MAYNTFTVPNVTLPTPTSANIGTLRSPTYVEGYVGVLSTVTSPIAMTAVDQFGNPVIFSFNGLAGTPLTVTATSTSTQNGGSTFNNSYRGAQFPVIFTSVVATCTVRINIQQTDTSGYFFTIASLSIDNVSTGQGSVGAPHPQNSLLVVYPGAIAGNQTTVGEPLPGQFRVQASITVINTTATSAVAFFVNFDGQI